MLKVCFYSCTYLNLKDSTEQKLMAVVIFVILMKPAAFTEDV